MKMGELSDNIEGIGPKYEQKLINAGITTLRDLREMDLAVIDSQTSLGLEKLQDWQIMAKLQIIEGIDNQYSEALLKSNIQDLETLLNTEAAIVVTELNNRKDEGVIPQGVSIAQVLTWQNDAEEIITLQSKRYFELTPEEAIVWEAMTCRGQRNYYEDANHPCRWFHQFGPFHAYDVDDEESLIEPEGYLKAFYVGERYQIPEILSGCRKAPLMSIGLNPNLRAVTQPYRIYPYFDNIQQYANHFRYRTTFKYRVEQTFYDDHIDLVTGKALFKDGDRIPLYKQYVTMYKEYENILKTFETNIGIADGNLALGEDVSYYNFVACHSPKWDMNSSEEEGIIAECFLKRKFFVKQLKQSAPKVLILFGKPIMESFVEFFRETFDETNIPDPDQTYQKILNNNNYYMNLDGELIRVIFSPHASGAPLYHTLNASDYIVEALVEEYESGNIKYDPILKHLERTDGYCFFCNNRLFYIGDCPYQK
jgi:hypothetical protein